MGTHTRLHCFELRHFVNILRLAHLTVPSRVARVLLSHGCCACVLPLSPELVLLQKGLLIALIFQRLDHFRLPSVQVINYIFHRCGGSVWLAEELLRVIRADRASLG